MGIEKIDRGVERAGYWWSAIGLLTGFLTWVASKLEWLSEKGFAEWFLAALLLTLFLLLTVAAGLASWRYFSNRAVPVSDGTLRRAEIIRQARLMAVEFEDGVLGSEFEIHVRNDIRFVEIEKHLSSEFLSTLGGQEIGVGQMGGSVRSNKKIAFLSELDRIEGIWGLSIKVEPR